MAKKSKKKPGEDGKSVVPEYVRESRLLQRRKITKRKLPSFSEAMLLLHAPEALRLYWKAILEGLEAGDKTALEAAGEIFNYVRGKGMNLSITQQLLNQNIAAGDQSPVKGCDAFLRELAEARTAKAIQPPSNVIDIRPVETAAAAPAGE